MTTQYHWVRYNGEWEVARKSELQGWWLTSSEKRLHDGDFDEIGARIASPDEPSDFASKLGKWLRGEATKEEERIGELRRNSDGSWRVEV